MGAAITVRDIDPSDKSWLQREAKRLGISMEELVRRLIHERREDQKARNKKEKPSEVFQRCFGPEHGVELPPRGRYGYRPVGFVDDENAM